MKCAFRLTTLIELLRANHDPGVLVDRAQGGPTAHIHSGILQVRVCFVTVFCNMYYTFTVVGETYKNVFGQARDFDDPPGLMEKTEYLLREWISIHYSATAGRDPTRAFSIFVQQVWPIAVSIHVKFIHITVQRLLL